MGYNEDKWARFVSQWYRFIQYVSIPQDCKIVVFSSSTNYHTLPRIFNVLKDERVIRLSVQDSFQSTIEALKNIDSCILIGYASACLKLAEASQGVPLFPRINGVFTCSDSINTEQIEFIEKSWETSLRCLLSMTELGVVATSCKNRLFHFELPSGIFSCVEDTVYYSSNNSSSTSSNFSFFELPFQIKFKNFVTA
jgi:hypothetical protein